MRINFLGIPMDNYDMDQTVSIIDERISKKKFTQHVVVNVAKIINMRTDKDLAESVTACDIINIDGQGVVWGARFLGFDIKERVAGIDLFLRLLELSSKQNYPVFFLGAKEDVVLEACEKSLLAYPELKIAGHHHGYFWEDEAAIVNKIKSSGARLLFVAITSPKKENFINRWKDSLSVDFVMGVGGTFDVISGKVNRAPKFMQRWGMEWLYRVIQEPRRMWKRYLVTNMKFALLLIKSKFAKS